MAARNANLQEILRETRAASGRADLDVAHAADHTFWMGDLNYRLDPRADLPPSAARASAATSPAAAAGRAAPEAPAAVFEVVVPDDLEAGGGGDGGDDVATTTVAARCSVGGAARPQLRRGAGAAASGKLELTSARSETAALKKDYYHRQDEQNGLVLAKVNARDWGGLMRWDQLRASQAAGEAFAGFVEGPIDFPPTFKVQRRRGLTYKDQRVPSYCDRILWRSMPALAADVTQLTYRALPEVSTSDHKPVCATFAIATAPAAAAGGEGGAHDGDGGGGGGGGGEPTSWRLHVRRLQLTNIIAADIGDTSDPYCVFHTNPPGLLVGGPKRTSVKYRVPGVSATGEARWGQRLGLSRASTPTAAAAAATARRRRGGGARELRRMGGGGAAAAAPRAAAGAAHRARHARRRAL